MGSERSDAEREMIARKILETARELEQLIKGGSVPKPTYEDPREAVFWAAHGRLEDVILAKAGFLSELIELVLPEVKLTATPIRALDKGRDPARVQALEALFGSVPARARALPWLDVPAVRLLGGRGPMDAVKASIQDTGIILAHEFFLLVDGRLTCVDSVGTWGVRDRQLEADTTIVSARELTPDEFIRAISDFDFMFLLSALRWLLHDPNPARQGQHVPDLAERQERFAALMADLDRVLTEHVAQLRRMGDSPT